MQQAVGWRDRECLTHPSQWPQIRRQNQVNGESSGSPLQPSRTLHGSFYNHGCWEDIERGCTAEKERELLGPPPQIYGTSLPEGMNLEDWPVDTATDAWIIPPSVQSCINNYCLQDAIAIAYMYSITTAYISYRLWTEHYSSHIRGTCSLWCVVNLSILIIYYCLSFKVISNSLPHGRGLDHIFTACAILWVQKIGNSVCCLYQATVLHFMTINCWQVLILYWTWGRIKWVETLYNNWNFQHPSHRVSLS